MGWFRRSRPPGRHERGAGIPLPQAARALPSAPFVPLVELGFRDGSTAALEPGSAHALALQRLARAIAGRE